MSKLAVQRSAISDHSLFDGGDTTAKLLLSNGEMLEAVRYEAGASGFVTAHWANSHSMELEIPNSCIEGDGKKLTPWQHKVVKKKPAGRPKKKPAAAMPVLAQAAAEHSPSGAAGDDGLHDEDDTADDGLHDGENTADDGLHDGEDTADATDVGQNGLTSGHESAETTLKLQKAHNNSWTIVICSNSRDRSQILWVWQEMCSSSGKEPRVVCDRIMECLQSEIIGIKQPVAKNPDLVGLKTKAKSLRAALLDEGR